MSRYIYTINDIRIAYLTPSLIVAIPAEVQILLGHEAIFKRILCEEGLLLHCGRAH